MGLVASHLVPPSAGSHLLDQNPLIMLSMTSSSSAHWITFSTDAVLVLRHHKWP